MPKAKKEVKEAKKIEPEKPIELTLPVDISTGKKDIFYGRRGDKVKVITDRGTVYIVEDKKGNRFSVEKSIF